MTKYKKIRDVNGRHNYHMTLKNGNEFYVSGDVGDYIKSLEEAIAVTHSCTELPTSTQLLSDCKKRFKELEGKGNLDFRSYRNGYLDSFSKNVVSKLK